MSDLSARLQAEGFSHSVLSGSVEDILNSTRLLGLATLSADGSPDACNLYFAYDSDLRIYVLTPPSSEHGQNIGRDPRVAASVADTQQTGDGGKRGLQIMGHSEQAVGEELNYGLAAYRERFPATAAALMSEQTLLESGWESRIYLIIPELIKIFDERIFGFEQWVTAHLA
jgi:uncharacterized protein YhbP (UPF0306 family)